MIGMILFNVVVWLFLARMICFVNFDIILMRYSDSYLDYLQEGEKWSDPNRFTYADAKVIKKRMGEANWKSVFKIWAWTSSQLAKDKEMFAFGKELWEKDEAKRKKKYQGRELTFDRRFKEWANKDKNNIRK